MAGKNGKSERSKWAKMLTPTNTLECFKKQLIRVTNTEYLHDIHEGELTLDEVREVWRREIRDVRKARGFAEAFGYSGLFGNEDGETMLEMVDEGLRTYWRSG